MTTGPYLSINTLNVIGLSAWNKRQRLTEWIQKQDLIYSVYKRPTSKQGTHTDWKWRACKRYFTQMESKKKKKKGISEKIDFIFFFNLWWILSYIEMKQPWVYMCSQSPSPLHLPLHPLPLGLPSAPDPSVCLMHPTWAGDLLHPRKYTCFNAVLLKHPTLAFSHRA